MNSISDSSQLASSTAAVSAASTTDDSRDGDHIVQTHELTKRFGDFTALDHCSIDVVRGEIFGLLGPNGAGKSTLIRLLLGFLAPTAGHSLIDGCDPTVDGVGLRRRVAYLPGDARLPRHMRGSGVLKFFADIHPFGDLDQSRRVAELLELDTTRRVGFMSTGMRQKLALSVVFGVNTPLLILDEPTANLDPTVRGEVLNLVLAARDQGRTVIFSSHVLSEIEDTCDRVVFLRRGLLAHSLTMHDLFQRHRITAALVGPEIDESQIPEALRDRIEIRQIRQGKTHSLQIDTSGDLSPLLGWLDSLNLTRVRAEPLGLRTIYNSVHSGAEITP